MAVQFVFDQLAAQRVAVNSQDIRSPGLVTVNSIQNSLDKTLLKFSHGFVEEDASLDHLAHKPFQLILHLGTLRKNNAGIPKSEPHF
jgi:hypothetical protein